METMKLILSIVERGQGAAMLKLYRKRQVPIHLQCPGKGTATSEIMDILGLGSSEKDVVVSFAAASAAKKLLHDLDNELRGHTGGAGIVVAIPISGLNSLIAKALALRGGTGMIVIETLTAEDKAAVDTVVNALSEDQQPRVLPVLSTLTTEQKTGGYPNAQGHLQLAKALADAVAGTTVSTASGWPYGAIAAGTFATGWPEKAAVTGNHEDYGTPEAPTTPQQTIKTKVDGNDAMTWLFMGDSITHGAAWTGGYDSLAQLFENLSRTTWTANRTSSSTLAPPAQTPPPPSPTWTGG